MKSRHLAISAVLLTLTGLAWAAPDMRPHKQHHGSPGDTVATEQAGMDCCNMSPMHGGMNMHGNMQLMHEQMARIQETEDPATREELMQQHMATMEQMMRMMQGIHSGNHMGHMMSQGMKMGHDTAPGKEL